MLACDAISISSDDSGSSQPPEPTQEVIDISSDSETKSHKKVALVRLARRILELSQSPALPASHKPLSKPEPAAVLSVSSESENDCVVLAPEPPDEERRTRAWLEQQLGSDDDSFQSSSAPSYSDEEFQDFTSQHTDDGQRWAKWEGELCTACYADCSRLFPPLLLQHPAEALNGLKKSYSSFQGPPLMLDHAPPPLHLLTAEFMLPLDPGIDQAFLERARSFAKITELTYPHELSQEELDRLFT